MNAFVEELTRLVWQEVEGGLEGQHTRYTRAELDWLVEFELGRLAKDLYALIRPANGAAKGNKA